MDACDQIKQCILLLEQLLEHDTKSDFFACTYKNLSQYHFGLGTWIRNHMLHEDSALFQMFSPAGVLQLKCK